jgi:hypothetical protein
MNLEHADDFVHIEKKALFISIFVYIFSIIRYAYISIPPHLYMAANSCLPRSDLIQTDDTGYKIIYENYQ